MEVHMEIAAADRPPLRPMLFTGKSLSLQVLGTTDELIHLSREWLALLTRVSRPAPTQSPDWLLDWWRVFGRGELRVVTFRDGERLVAIAPLYRSVHWHKPGIPFRRISFLANGEKESDEIASDAMGIVCETGYETEVGSGLAELLNEGGLGPWDELTGQRILVDTPATTAWLQALARMGFGHEVVSTTDSYYVALPASWEEYLQSLPSSRRYRLRKSMRDMEAWLGGPLRLRRIESQSDLPLAMAELAELHAGRWQTAGRKGVFASDRFRRFHEYIMPKLLRQGALDLLFLDGPDGPVASLYNIVWDDRVHFYQCGRRTDIPGRLRPGLVIHALAIERAIALGQREYDFLGGRSRYKQELAPTKRGLFDFRIVHPSVGFREWARVALGASLRSVKRAWQGSSAAAIPESADA